MNDEPEPFSFDEWTRFVLQHLRAIDAGGDHGLADALRERLDQLLPTFDSQQVLGHMDLNDEHVLIDGHSRRASAVMDRGAVGPGHSGG